MRGLSSGFDGWEARVQAVVTARTEEDLDFLHQAYRQAARLFKKHL